MATTGSRFIDLTGQRFTRLTVLGIDTSRPRGKGCKPYWICRCECGVIKPINGEHLRSGGTKSCGCWRQESPFLPRQTTHGDYRAPEYRSWCAMLSRCRNPNAHAYDKYGGRGIAVCERWLTYVNFLADMGRRPSLEYSIDRIDNSKGYSADNCRWANRREQSNNTAWNIRMTHEDVTRTISEWSRLTGIIRATIYGRLNKGWTVGQALGFEPRPSSKSPGF